MLRGASGERGACGLGRARAGVRPVLALALLGIVQIALRSAASWVPAASPQLRLRGGASEAPPALARRVQDRTREGRTSLPEVQTQVSSIHGLEELQGLIDDGGDVVLHVTFRGCRPCEAFAPEFQRLAQHFGGVRFVEMSGDEDPALMQYARRRLRMESFAVYSQGELKHIWSGYSVDRFVAAVTDHLRSVSSGQQRPDVEPVTVWSAPSVAALY